jgi:anti-sigma factor RsiW
MGGMLRRASEHERVEAMFSAYLDGRVTDSERAFVERHLEVCVDCARHLTTLRATVAAVREMPKVHAPRSFALPRSMAKQSQIAPWLYPFLRAATAVAAFLFALTVAGDLFLRSSLTASTPVALAPTSVVMQSEALRSAQPATAPAVASAPQTSAPPAAFAPLATHQARNGRSRYCYSQCCRRS